MFNSVLWKRLPIAILAACFLTAGYVPGLRAEDKPAPKKKEGPRYKQMDYGPFLCASVISWPTSTFDNGPGSYTGDSTARGILLKVADEWNAGIVFDCDAMRMSCGWIGTPFLMKGLIFDGGHGESPRMAAAPLFQTPYGPGWANAEGSFKDPREDSIKPLPPPGRLPTEWAKYRGLYRHGDQVVLSYTVGKSQVYDLPGYETSGDAKALVRTIQVGGSDVPMGLMLVDGNPDIPVPAKKAPPKGKKEEPQEAPKAPEKPGPAKIDGDIAVVGSAIVGVSGAPAGSKLAVNEQNQVYLKIPATKAPFTFKVLYAGGGEAGKAGFAALLKATPKPVDVEALTKGGPAKWTETVETKGVVSDAKEPYVVDNLTVPENNPYNSWMRIGAFDFFSDGTRAALTTWSGDVWIVSGIDDKLEKLTWKRYATGLHQPLGLKIVNDEIYVVGHDQITRLHDLNNDGEADFYECFNNDWELTTAFHAFAFDLHTDPEGNFYFAFGSPVHGGGRGFQKITKHHGTILKVSKDGSKMEIYATGFRAPNGICVSPTGQVTSGDNEGTWVPTSPLHWVKQGSFNGVTDSAHGVEVHEPKPVIWLSHNGGVDNSCGGQAWVTSDKWGPFKGELLHLSYGTSSLFLVPKEEVNGQMQGGSVKFPVKFTSSAMRPRFNPKDGQLYITGLKGWQTNANKDGGFDRVRFTGAPVHMPNEVHFVEKGVVIGFTGTLDPASANDVESYAAEMWNYKWTSEYGSPEVRAVDESENGSVKPKGSPGHNKLNVKSAKLLPDGKSVFLEIPDIQPVMQMRVKYKLKAADGTIMNSQLDGTIHNLGKNTVVQ